jgi:hypothetical protein
VRQIDKGWRGGDSRAHHSRARGRAGRERERDTDTRTHERAPAPTAPGRNANDRRCKGGGLARQSTQRTQYAQHDGGTFFWCTWGLEPSDIARESFITQVEYRTGGLDDRSRTKGNTRHDSSQFKVCGRGRRGRGAGAPQPAAPPQPWCSEGAATHFTSRTLSFITGAHTQQTRIGAQEKRDTRTRLRTQCAPGGRKGGGPLTGAGAGAWRRDCLARRPRPRARARNRVQCCYHGGLRETAAEDPKHSGLAKDPPRAQCGGRKDARPDRRGGGEQPGVRSKFEKGAAAEPGAWGPPGRRRAGGGGCKSREQRQCDIRRKGPGRRRKGARGRAKQRVGRGERKSTRLEAERDRF